MKPYDHPEMRPGEVFVGNYEVNKLPFDLSKVRVGNTPCDILGRPTGSDTVPVFMLRSDLPDNGDLIDRTNEEFLRKLTKGNTNE